MANIIGKLRAILSLNTTNFTAGLQNATKYTKRFRAETSGMGLGLAAVGAKFAAVAAAGATLWGTIRRFSELGGLADTVDQLQISANALGGFRLAATDAGVEVNALDGSLRKMLKNIGEAASGNNSLEELFNKLGLTGQGLSGKSTEEAFIAIAEAIGRIPTASGQALAASKIFGKEADRLTRIFARGGDALRGYVDEYTRLSGGVSQSSLTKIDAAGKAWERITIRLKSLADTIILTLEPALERLYSMLGVNTPQQEMIGAWQQGLERIASGWRMVGDKPFEDRLNPSQWGWEKPKGTTGPIIPVWEGDRLVAAFMGPPPWLANGAPMPIGMSAPIVDPLEDFFDQAKDNIEKQLAPIIGGGSATAKELGIVEGLRRGPRPVVGGVVADQPIRLFERIATATEKTANKLEKMGMNP